MSCSGAVDMEAEFPHRSPAGSATGWLAGLRAGAADQ